MKYLLLSGTALIGLSTAVMAADLPVYPVEEPVAYAPAFTWTGFYLGAHGGYASGDTDFTAYFDDVAIDDGSFDLDGAFAGGQIGYNIQTDNFVLGLEADASWTDIDGDGDAFDPLNLDPSVPSGSIEWMGTFRGRVGFALDRFMPYVTGGLAFADVESSVTNLDGAGDDRSESETHFGWTVGAGVEAALSDNWSFKVEYLYVDLGEETVDFGTVDDGGVLIDVSSESDLKLHTIKAGLNYRF